MSILSRDNWTDKVDFMITDIYEYDMKRAGLSICKEFQLLDEKEIEKLESMDKLEADILLGKRQTKDREFKKKLKEGFANCRLAFGEQNDLRDSDIVSVKKDAIFCKKFCPNNIIGDNIEFREKHHYHALMILNKLELYWNADTMHIDVKGIVDDVAALHNDYMLKAISTVIAKLSSYNQQSALKFVVKLMNDYKHRNLPAGYYRELNSGSKFCQYVEGRFLLVDAQQMSDEYVKTMNIEYNYLNVLVPLLDIVVG